MASQQQIIYLPGLGDPNAGEKFLLGFWGIFGVKVHYSPVVWGDGQPFVPKLDRIISQIDELHSQGFKVSLVGVSAGASAAINALAIRHDIISGLVCICGKLKNPQTIAEVTFQRNPAFKESLGLLPAGLNAISASKKPQLLTIHPLKDGVVPVPDTFIDGVRSKTIPTVGHAFSIFYALTLGSWSIVRFLKSHA
jgi:pimeloyl-ACP methyl ester carboxylesterase